MERYLEMNGMRLQTNDIPTLPTNVCLSFTVRHVFDINANSDDISVCESNLINAIAQTKEDIGMFE